MGYILPMQSLQSAQYANRMLYEYDVMKVRKLDRVQKVASFREEFEDSANEEQMAQQEDRHIPIENVHAPIENSLENQQAIRQANQALKAVDQGRLINKYA